MNLKLNYSCPIRFRVCIIAFFIVFISTYFNEHSALAYDLTGTYGIYQPDNKVITQMYGAPPIGSLRLNVPYHASMDWIIAGHIVNLVNEPNTEDSLTIVSLMTGFEKRLNHSDSDKKLITPFVGAGLSLSSISGNPELNLKETIYSWAIYKEIGLLVPVWNDSSSQIIINVLQIELQNNPKSKPYFEGSTISIGLRVGF